MLSDSLYIDNIEEYVQDEGKIVSYKWLSRTLDVPANAAKQMLYAYVHDHRSKRGEGEGGEVHVTYTVSGLTAEGSHQVSLVWEEDLEASKQQLEVLLGVHVYSVQKCKLKDSGLLYMANHDINKQHLTDYARWNTISCGDVARVVAKRRGSSEKATTIIKTQLPTLSRIKQEASNGTSTDVVKSQAESKPKIEAKHPPAPKKAGGARQKGKGGVASFFSRVQAKSEAESGSSKKPTTAPATVDAPTVKKEIKQKEIKIEPLPKKSPVKSPRKQGRQQSKASKTSLSQTTVLHDSDLDIDDEDSEDTESKKQDREPPVVRSKKTARTSRGKKATAKDVSHAKKRKRVQTMSSDEELSDGEGRAPPATGAEREATAAAGDGGGRRRRKRVKKMVSKMHINEEGEMVTERSFEFVSTDDSAPEDSSTAGGAAVKGESPFKKAAGTKQSSLTSFFKK